MRNMTRKAAAAVALSTSMIGSMGCGGADSETTAAAATLAPTPALPTDTLRVSTPEIAIAPGAEKTFCYFTTLDTTTEVGVKQYRSSMTPGSHHMIMFLTEEPTQPDGTFAECDQLGGSEGPDGGGDGGGFGALLPVWAYAAQEAESALTMPEGIGVTLAPGQPVMVQMHYLNASPDELSAHVDIDIDTYREGVEFVSAAVYATFSTQINVPPGGTGVAEGSCPTPEGATFLFMSTHSHRFTTRAAVHDGPSLVLETTSWEHPAVSEWPESGYTFESGTIDYRCEYANPTSAPVTVGESAKTDEMCMAVGYFYPATTSVFCLNSTAF